MEFLKRLFGICETKPPQNADAWIYSEGSVEIDLESVPELSRRGGAIRLEGKGLPERILVFRGDNNKLYAVRNKCTHMGRRIDPLPEAGIIRCCSVSKSTFDYSGQVLSGPAKGPITRYKTELRDGKLIIAVI